PRRTGLRLEPRALLYGFSRGAQYAHRFALAYPEKVAGVAAMAAGTYTLPQTTWQDPDGTATTLNMPYGVADLQSYSGLPFRVEPLRQVSFWIAVGSSDHQAQDVPRSWDKYIGDCRVDRATSFVDALERQGVPVTLQEFANTQHVETAEMRAMALQFLASRAGIVPAAP
ncbi:MAG: alpha/beta hydrolase, partial [Chloroflexota bacterium]